MLKSVVLVLAMASWIMVASEAMPQPEQLVKQEHSSLYHQKRHHYSKTLASELRRFFDRPLEFVVLNLSENQTLHVQKKSEPEIITTSTTTTTMTTLNPATILDSTTTIEPVVVEHNRTVPLLNDANMMVFKWLNWTNSSMAFPDMGSASAAVLSKRMTLAEMFQYNTSWIIGLAVIATVIGVFFLGCVIVICYTRRPYRRSGKVYEIESTAKKNQKIPQVPTIHPATKTATLTRSKEVFY